MVVCGLVAEGKEGGKVSGEGFPLAEKHGIGITIPIFPLLFSSPFQTPPIFPPTKKNE